MSDEVTREKVKGIKFGTWAKYKEEVKDPDMLYFITEKGGAIYRGDSIVIPNKVIEELTTTAVTSIGGISIGDGANQNKHTFTIETFSKKVNGTQADPVALTFSVYSQEAVNAVVSVILNVMNTHREVSEGVYADGKATNTAFGHIKLTDTVDMTGANNPAAASGGTAVTPKAVYDAIAEAIGGIGGAMVFKGQVGKAAAYDPTATYAEGDYCEYDSKLYRCTTAIETAEAWNADHWTEITRNASDLPTNGYEAGWTYRVCAPNTYAGEPCEVGDIIIAINNGPASGSTVINDDWTIGQVNTDGTVTIAGALINNALVLGAGSTNVKPLANGTAGQYLRIVNGVPQWANHPNTDHGIAKCTCSTEASTAAKAATLVSGSNFYLVNGAVVAVKFTYAVLANSTLSVEGTGAKDIYFRGAAITSNVIEAGDTATLMYNGLQWDLLSVDKEFKPIATSGDYDDLIHKPIHNLVNSQNASVTARTVTDTTATDTANRIFVVKFTNGIIFDTVSNPTLAVMDDAATPNAIISAKPIKWHGANLVSGQILAGDVVTMIYDGSKFNVLAVDRKVNNEIKTTVVNGNVVYDNNLVTDKAVYDFVKAQIDANALWWEEMI